MDFLILGPLEVLADGRRLALGGPKQRAVLAMLLLHANEVVSRDRLIEAVWGERPPDGAGRSLDSYLSRLRAQLGAERLVRRPPGHLLQVRPDELDLDRFQALVERADELSARGDASRAAEELRGALALWRGRALADVQYEPVATGWAEQLEERRLLAVEARIEADLACGERASLVPELQQLMRDHPLRERLVAQLMLALYRAGRQADALATYAAARQRLATDLGLEPGPQLRELERQILQHDEALPHDAGIDLHGSPARGGRRPRARWAIGGVALAALAALGVALLVGRTGESPDSTPDAGSRLLSLAAGSGDLRHAEALSATPAAIAAGDDAVWLAQANSHDVLRIDPANGTVVDRIRLPGQPSGVALGRRAVWVASTLTGTLSRIDADTGTITQTIRLGGADASAVAVGGAGLWVTDTTDHALLQIDEGTGAVIRTVTIDGRPSALTVAATSVWVADHDAGRVIEIDAASGETLATVDVGGGPVALALVRDAVWVANSLDATVSRIDPGSGRVVATIAVGSGPSGVATAGDSVWVTNQYASTVTRIDARSNRVAATVPARGQPMAIAAGADAVWVGAGPAAATHRGGTLTLATTNRFASIDPAFQNLATPNQFGKLAYDTLVTFRATGGTSGLRLVPDLALALPPPTRGGTAYAFRLRRGIRYSDGRLVRARDFRRAIERLFRVGSQGADYFSGLVGSAACAREPKGCDLAQGIRTDDAAGTVEFRLTAADPDFLYKLTPFSYATPIPPGTPERDVGSKPVPGTGPYRLLPWRGGTITFERNQHFREWSHAAQPNGNPDRIVWRFYPSLEAETRAVSEGRADWIFGILPPRELRRLGLELPAQLHDNRTFIVDFIPLNTHVTPFNDVRVRQALNFAVDRRKIVTMYGGPSTATPTCQPLPAGFLGYRRYCPFTAGPRRDGAWSAPDLARAKRLVARSGTRGQMIDVWGGNDELGVPRALPAYVASVLRTLGYRTRLHTVPLSSITYEQRRGFQLSVDGDWVPDYPAPSAFLPPFFSCRGGYTNGYVCDRALDRAMRAAAAAQLRDPGEAARLWAKADRMIVDRAYWVPTVISHAPTFVSRRLRNYQYNPVWDFVATQAWLR